ncbi:hypothetical protein Bca52824_041389 [Brassica carinata]|uniref:Uncharacterized protein n=1 Tax=Brassica carinata TaxID=52824 RepID=A0A8X7UWE1_BRACI|nr:hypothetical protein Bca52824_041389 [Brassica carinata]
MGRAVYLEVDNFVEDLKRAIIESYGLVGMSVAIEMSYWLGEPRILCCCPTKCKLGMRLLMCTRNEVNGGETDLTEDEIIRWEFAEIEAVYASNGFGMREVDGTHVKFRIKGGEDGGDEDYDYNLWHDFVGPKCEWGDDKDEDGGCVDEGRDYIGSSRISMENIEEASNNLGVESVIKWPTRIIQIQIKKRTQVWTAAPKCWFSGLLKAVQHAYFREVGGGDDSLGRAVELYGFEDVEASPNNGD